MQGEVTALKADRKGRQRLHVFLDGAWALSLSASVAAGLHVGQRLAPEEVEKLQQQELLQAATHQALRLISRRPRSESELRQGWERRGVAPDVQQAALEHLRQSRQVDDVAFAATWVENREAFRPRSARALRSELRRKGVAEEAITSAVEGVDESEAAYRAGPAIRSPGGRLGGRGIHSPSERPARPTRFRLGHDPCGCAPRLE